MIRALAVAAALLSCHETGGPAAASDVEVPDRCDGSAADACLRAGRLLERKSEYEVAAGLYKKACDADSGVGCRQLSRLASTGLGVQRDLHTAMNLEERACTLNDGVACAIQAERYWTATGVYPSEQRARELYNRAVDLLDAQCKAGSGEACSQLGVVFTNGWGIQADLERAEAAYRSGADLDSKACKEEDGSACLRLASAKKKGRGVPVDAAASVTLFETACLYGVANACRELGADASSIPLARIYEAECSKGRCAQSCAYAAEAHDALAAPDRAVELHLKACSMGHGSSCERVKNTKGAVDAYRAACEHGDGAACAALGGLLTEARGVEEALSRGCELAEPSACLTLGELLKSGSGVLSKNEERSRQVFEKACNLGRKAGCDNASGPAVLKR